MTEEHVRNDPHTDSSRPGSDQADNALELLGQSDAIQTTFTSPEHHECNEHIASIYENQAEQFAVAVPFIRHGLEHGEKCLYVVDDNSKADLVAAMERASIDVEAAQDSGALTFLTKETYIRNGSFTPDEQLAFLADAIESATREYPAARVAVEMTCFLDEELAYDDLVEYEERYNTLNEDADAIALCQYNKSRFPACVIRDTIRAHPHVIIDGTLSHNVYYTPPEEFFNSDEAAYEVKRMSAIMKELADAETELERQNERLEEFASVVSHDLQNPLRVAQGYLELMQEEHNLEQLDTVEGALARMDSLIDDLLTLARTETDGDDFEVVSLADVVARCWETVPTADATLMIDTTQSVWADSAQVQRLLENIVGNAVEHGGEAVTVTIGDLNLEGPEGGFFVEDDGIGISESERKRIFETGYTSTETGTGFGLPIVKQIADVHGWSIQVTEGVEGGARFEFREVKTTA